MSARTRLAAAILMAMSPVLAAAQEAIPLASTDDVIDNPAQRFDARLEYQQQPMGVTQWTTTLRYQRPYDLANGWTLAFRADMPFSINNDNPRRTDRTGVGDLLVQAALSRTFDNGNGFGMALRMIAPTASEREFGGGRWRLLPTVGYRFGLPSISAGSFFQPVLRYQFDFAGDPARGPYSDLQFAPSLNIALTDGWYFTLFPSTDFRYNFIHKEWFVPFNVEIGRDWSKTVATSLELSVPIHYEAHPLYLFKVEGRLTVLF